LTEGGRRGLENSGANEGGEERSQEPMREGGDISTVKSKRDVLRSDSENAHRRIILFLQNESYKPRIQKI
jgi:hypothetical protein